MNDELWMASFEVQKLFANPQKIFFLLIAQRDARADARVTKEQTSCLKGQAAARKKITMCLWHSPQRLIMHRAEPPAQAEIQPVRAQGVLPT